MQLDLTPNKSPVIDKKKDWLNVWHGDGLITFMPLRMRPANEAANK